MAASLVAGVAFWRRERGGYLLASLSALALLVGIAAIVAFVSPYVYELPTHHCPFCLLQREYGYVGYALYAALLGATVGGVGVGALMPFRSMESLAQAVPAIQRRLAFTAVMFHAAFRRDSDVQRHGVAPEAGVS